MYQNVLFNNNPERTSMYLSVLLTTILVQLGTSLYCLGTAWYHLVPPCTALYHSGTKQYQAVHTSTYCLRIFLCKYILVCSGTYKKASGGTEIGMYTDVPVHTAWFRYTGSQMMMYPADPEALQALLVAGPCQSFLRAYYDRARMCAWLPLSSRLLHQEIIGNNIYIYIYLYIYK